jgi:predicted RNase H-like nuclease (RuvC/YqgF family)
VKISPKREMEDMSPFDQESQQHSNSDNRCYLGLDLYKYESGRKTYSLVLLCSGKVNAKYDDVGLEKVVRLCWEWNVSAIAIDNITELAENRLELGRFVSLLPEKTGVYQINLTGERERDFREMLRSLGIYTGQLTPSKTAYYLALLASLGYGQEILKKEARTKIIVRKNRILSAGGMSSNRYKRKVRTAVLQIVNDIKESLDANGFDYELFYRKSGGGLDGATFTVSASRESLERVIKPRKGTSVSIEIRPEYKVKLLFEQRGKESRPLIVGIDPGMTYGIAVLDIDGKAIYVGSLPMKGRSDIVEIIERLGKPIVVATDVFPVPSNVKKIASQFGADVYTPEKTLSVEEKRMMAEEARNRGEIDSYDTHVRDAYAAAYMAYRAFSRKLSEVNSYLEKTGLNLPSEKIKKRIIEGMSVTEAIEEELREYLESVNKNIRLVVPKEDKKAEEKGKNYTEAFEMIRKENMILLNKIEEMEKELASKERELELYKKGVLQLDRENHFAREIHRLKEALAEYEKTLKEKEKELEQLQAEYKNFYNYLLKVSKGEMFIVSSIPSLTKRNIGEISGIKGKMIFVENPDAYQNDAVSELIRLDPAAVLLEGPISGKGLVSLLENNGIPVLSLENFEHQKLNGLLFVSKDIEEEITKRKMELQKSIDDKEKRKLLFMIEKYKEERAKGLKKISH